MSVPEKTAEQSAAVTVLTSHGPRMAKLIGGDETGRLIVKESYEDAKHFAVTQRSAADLDALARLLEALACRPRSCIIRGEPMPGIDRSHCRRLLHPRLEPDGRTHPASFKPAARRWLALDFDGIADPGFHWLADPERTARYLLRLLSWHFHASGAVLQATGSAGIKPGIHARLWCILKLPISDAEAKRWLANAPVDRSLFNPIQAHYTAAPVFADGIADPVRWRVAKIPGPPVPVPELPEPKPVQRAASATMPSIKASNAYATAALKGEADAVATAPTGERHHRLHLACIKLWRLIDGGSLTVSETAATLMSAAVQSGIDDPDALLRAFVARSMKSAARQSVGGSQ
jgi:hypothetical protein